jgi:conjugative transfer region protein (TIGR03748 family)
MRLAPEALLAGVLVISGCATVKTEAPASTLAALPAPPAPPLPQAPLVSLPTPPAVVLTTTPLRQDETQVGRYTTTTTAPDDAEANPLAVVARVHFPRDVVSTVGDAVRYLLVRTGYRLEPDATLDPKVNQLFALRLPDQHRALGPYRVDTMLGVLMGRPFELTTDPSTRTVNYIVRAAPTATWSSPVAAAPTSN